MNFREFVNGGAFQNTATTDYDTNPFFGTSHDINSLPTPTLDMPSKTIQGKIRRINYTQNPISIHLDNGSIWNLTKKQWDYLKSTNKEPRINSNIQIEIDLDGTIRSINIQDNKMVGDLSKKENNKKSILGGKTNKPERTFGKKFMPF